MQPRQLKWLAKMRWASGYDSIQAVLATFQPVLSSSEDNANGNDHNQPVTAKGLLLQTRSFQFVLCLIMFDKLLAVTNALSKLLQAQSLYLTASVH